MEKIVRCEKNRTTGERLYIVKWKGYSSSENTREPEAHLLCNKLLLSFWKGKKNPAELERVTRLQEAALAEIARRSTRAVHALDPSLEKPISEGTSAAPAAVGVSSCCDRLAQSPCKPAYDHGHQALQHAVCLVFDTETSGLAGCVLNIGWLLADSNGRELASYDKLWHLPAGERIHSHAFAAHQISAATLSREGVDPKPELLEFYALVSAAIRLGVCVVAHNASFDVGRLNHTAHKHRVKVCSLLRSADMLCTMHNATKRCGLRKRGGKTLKPPTNEELYMHLLQRKPAGPLHRALPDCRVTLASFIEARKLRWW